MPAALRLVHTADWHLGQELHGFPREAEHGAFLDWLAGELVRVRADALVVAGDLFDSQNPPVAAQAMLYRFLRRLSRDLPALDVVLIAGNHDSAARLEAPAPLLDALGVRVVGGLPRQAGGALDLDRLVVPLTGADGRVRAQCVAVPFLRLPELLAAAPAGDDPAAQLAAGARELYREAIAGARSRLAPGQALVATGHLYLSGGDVSELSERRILGGHQHALPAEIFPDDVVYAALGHLHKPQRVGGRDHVRYAGSPLPLSVTERDYPHQVVLVELGDGERRITALPVPRTVGYLRVPAHGAAPSETVLAMLADMILPEGDQRESWPYLEVAVALDRPAPELRRQVEATLAGRPVRLARLAVSLAGAGGGPDLAEAPDLAELAPEQVFAACWRSRHGGEPEAPLLDAFRTLLAGLDEGEAPS